MPLRLLILLSLARGFVAAAATAARSQQRSVIPSCEEVLTIAQAKDAMNEPDAAIIRREVKLHTRVCDYYGAMPNAAPTHALGADWGPYADLRKRSVAWANANVCPVNKRACKALKLAMKAKSNTKSFALFGNALAKAGHVQRLHSGFGGNPAFLWQPHAGVSPADEFAWVEVYDTGTHHEFQVICTDKTDSSPDTSCAVTAARHAFDNLGA
jgi:hypothetical protein